MNTSDNNVFDIKLTYRGKTVTLPNITKTTSIQELHTQTRQSFDISDDAVIKLLHKGKKIEAKDDDDDDANDESTTPAFPNGIPSTTKAPKIVVLCTNNTQIQQLNSKKSDPLMRGFDNEKQPPPSSTKTCSCCWGPEHTNQNRHYKFVRFETCNHHAFGTRPTSTTPHAFRAMDLLTKLSTDPGIVSILSQRELVVNTLGEMDPIDDRIAQKKKAQGLCLLGYNTNRGLRIDIKLRTDDLSSFRSYPELVSTLIHELSHNWVGDHNELFFANYGTMRVEYLTAHFMLKRSGYVVNGKSSAYVAGVKDECSNGMDHILQAVLTELRGETMRYGVNIMAVQGAVEGRWRELKMEMDAEEKKKGNLLGARSNDGSNEKEDSVEGRRQRALAAAEQRLRAKKENGDGSSANGGA